jgi:homoserine kinase
MGCSAAAASAAVLAAGASGAPRQLPMSETDLVQLQANIKDETKLQDLLDC